MLALAGLLVAVGLLFHPVPAGGFEERASVLANTPWWGPIHIAIAAGFVLCVLGSLLVLIAGGDLTHPWLAALSWGAMAVGMVFFTGVALINGWVMHYLTAHGAPTSVPLLYETVLFVPVKRPEMRAVAPSWTNRWSSALLFSLLLNVPPVICTVARL